MQTVLKQDQNKRNKEAIFRYNNSEISINLTNLLANES